MKKSTLAMVLVLFVSAVTACCAVEKKTFSELDSPQMMTSNVSDLVTPELVGLSNSNESPSVLWLNADNQFDLKIIWRNQKGIEVKRPFEISAFAFSQDGRTKSFMINHKESDVLRLTNTARRPTWLTVVVRSTKKPGLTWTYTSWVSFGRSEFLGWLLQQSQQQTSNSSTNQTTNSNSNANASSVSQQSYPGFN